MASQVFSGVSNPTYTNNTGGNVRVVINYMAAPRGAGNTLGQISITWFRDSDGRFARAAGNVVAIGRNLAFTGGTTAGGGTGAGGNNPESISVSMIANNACPSSGNETGEVALPTEIMLATGQTFSADCGAYNVVIIPEAG